MFNSVWCLGIGFGVFVCVSGVEFSIDGDDGRRLSGFSFVGEEIDGMVVLF